MRYLLIQINNISKRTKLWVFIFHRGAGERLLYDYLHTSLPNWVIRVIGPVHRCPLLLQ